ncbi:hypothetical protein BN1723_019013, partial [Verticillium longisporum]
YGMACGIRWSLPLRQHW